MAGCGNSVPPWLRTCGVPEGTQHVVIGSDGGLGRHVPPNVQSTATARVGFADWPQLHDPTEAATIRSPILRNSLLHQFDYRSSGAPASPGKGGYKRSFDLFMLMLAAAALAPVWILVWLLIALAIRLDDGGPVVHVQRRAGRYGKPFEMLKFRTMVVGAERRTGPVRAARADRRVTRVGKVLRRFHLDEAPQAINVFKGEMSLVGPRPERPLLTRRIAGRFPQFNERLGVLPGIAGLAQSRGHYFNSPRDKLRYDRLYIANMSPWVDLKILAACAWKALRGGAGTRQQNVRTTRGT